MNKFVFAVLVSVFSYSAVAANTARFEGMIASQTCTVTVNGTPGSVTVHLPTVPTSALATLGDVAGLTEFSIEVSQCGYQGSYVSPRFIGNNLHSTGRLNNAPGSDYAKNVLVQVGITPGFFIHLEDQTMNSTYSIPLQGTGTNRHGSRNYYVSYFAMGPATPGKVLASVQYAIVYP